MHVVESFPHGVREIENCWITLSDGCRLAARIWLPDGAGSEPVPAILEYLPYRKRDGTAERDALTHPYFAGHGYASVRVDMRGNGESDGLMLDEYLAQEQDDAMEVIDWLVEQPWCSGQVGMIGISWGGFNGLQVAARQPAALKAVVTICSTDDRYADDIHYKGGCLLNENLGWAATMLGFSSRPPDPALVGERWRSLWLERLENLPLLAETWLRHQRRDNYWKHGSVCEDFGAIEAAVLVVGGWGDAYSNAVPRLLAGLQAPRLGIVGPWVHKYPHFAIPGPAIGFLQVCLRWWDHWLKGRDSGIMAEPFYRAYLMDSAPPAASYDRRDGRWVSEDRWPSPRIRQTAYALNPGRIEGSAEPEQALRHGSAQDVGAACGEYCAMWAGPEWPTDQRHDDAGSLCFETAPLEHRLELFGAPVAELELACDQPQAFVALRLCDVAPDGASTRVTFGILNLTHRDCHDVPAPLVPGRRYSVRVQLDDVAYALLPGHRLRLAVSTSYWPLIWPSPEAATLTLFTGASRLVLPERAAGDSEAWSFPAPEVAPPLDAETLREGSAARILERNLATGETLLRITDDFGVQRIRPHGHESGSCCREVYRIDPADPLSARAEIHWTQSLGRGDWQVRIESRSWQWADRKNFYLRAEIEAFEGDDKIFANKWETAVPRDMM